MEFIWNLGIECWLKLVKSQLIKYRDEDCSQAILRLWDLLDRSCPSTNIKVCRITFVKLLKKLTSSRLQNSSPNCMWFGPTFANVLWRMPCCSRSAHEKMFLTG